MSLRTVRASTKGGSDELREVLEKRLAGAGAGGRGVGHRAGLEERLGQTIRPPTPPPIGTRTLFPRRSLPDEVRFAPAWIKTHPLMGA